MYTTSSLRSKSEVITAVFLDSKKFKVKLTLSHIVVLIIKKIFILKKRKELYDNFIFR